MPPKPAAPDVWVVNASPLIALDRIGHVHLLSLLATDVVLPRAVMSEIGVGPRPLGSVDLGRHRVVAVEAIHPMVAAWDLGAGESQVVTWAVSQPGCVAVLDDRAARRCATALGVPTIGTLRVLLFAKRAGLIPLVAPLIDRLRQTGVYLSDAVVEHALKVADEPFTESSAIRSPTGK